MQGQPKNLFYMAPDMSTEEGKAAYHYVCQNFIKKCFLQNIRLYVALDSYPKVVSDGLIYFQGLFCNCNMDFLAKDEIDLYEFIKKMDAVVVYRELEDLRYIEQVYLSDVPIITFDDIENLFPKPKDIMKIMEKLKETANAIFNAYPSDEYEYILYNSTWGETLITFFWLKNLQKLVDKKILILCFKQEQAKFFKVSPYVSEAIEIPKELFVYFNTYFIDLPFIRNSTRDILKVSATCKYWEASPIETIREMLKIPESEAFGKYPIEIPNEAEKNAKSIFKELNLKQGTTVFLNPLGGSFKLLEGNRLFWDTLVSTLQEYGYDVVTNGERELFPKCKCIFLPFWETSVFIGLCGHIVGPMSGFIEAACAFNSKEKINWHITMPSAKDPWWRYDRFGFYIGKLRLLRKYGGDFSKKYLELNDELFYKLLFGNNIHNTIYQLGSTEENKLLAKEIAKQITSK